MIDGVSDRHMPGTIFIPHARPSVVAARSFAFTARWGDVR